MSSRLDIGHNNATKALILVPQQQRVTRNSRLFVGFFARLIKHTINVSQTFVAASSLWLSSSFTTTTLFSDTAQSG